MKRFSSFFIVFLMCLLIFNSSLGAAKQLSLDEVISEATEELQKIKDLSADVEIVQYHNSRSTKTTAFLQASKVDKLVRLQLSKPSVLEGQIIVANQETAEVKIYMPVTDQILVQQASEMVEDVGGIPIDFTDLSSLLTLEGVTVQLTEKIEVIENKGEVDGEEENLENENEIDNEEEQIYVLQVDGFQNQTILVYLARSTWFPQKVEVYEDDNHIGTLKLHNIKVNQDISREILTQLPDVKKIVQ